MPPALAVRNLCVAYGPIVAVRGVTFQVAPGRVAAIVGPNGAGKSSTLRGIYGLEPRTKGDVWAQGHRLSGGAHTRAQAGLAYVPEGRGVMPSLTVIDNLRLAILPLKRRKELMREMSLAERSDMVFELFPRLLERRDQAAGTMSGGEQQMLGLARALMVSPSILLLDEPSLGLAPLVIAEVYEVLDRIKASGITVILVEQYLRWALRVADDVHVMARGEIVHSSDAATLGADPERVLHAYLGGSNHVDVDVSVPASVLRLAAQAGDEPRQYVVDDEVDRLTVAGLERARTRLSRNGFDTLRVKSERAKPVTLRVSRELWDLTGSLAAQVDLAPDAVLTVALRAAASSKQPVTPGGSPRVPQTGAAAVRNGAAPGRRGARRAGQ
jgi:branched-chain amino acid transport system ATP-binding protein